VASAFEKDGETVGATVGGIDVVAVGNVAVGTAGMALVGTFVDAAIGTALPAAVGGKVIPRAAGASEGTATPALAITAGAVDGARLGAVVGVVVGVVDTVAEVAPARDPATDPLFILVGAFSVAVDATTTEGDKVGAVVGITVELSAVFFNVGVAGTFKNVISCAITHLRQNIIKTVNTVDALAISGLRNVERKREGLLQKQEANKWLLPIR
jgi:hypothetical protein